MDLLQIVYVLVASVALALFLFSNLFDSSPAQAAHSNFSVHLPIAPL